MANNREKKAAKKRIARLMEAIYDPHTSDEARWGLAKEAMVEILLAAGFATDDIDYVVDTLVERPCPKEHQEVFREVSNRTKRVGDIVSLANLCNPRSADAVPA